MLTVDTNILFYSLNKNCVEFGRAHEFMCKHQESRDFAICDLVLVELYVLLRNPRLLAKPMGAKAAVKTVENYRNNPNWKIVDYPGNLTQAILNYAAKPTFRYQRIYDVRIALSLLHHSIDTIATRNTKDFDGLGINTINPIDLEGA